MNVTFDHTSVHARDPEASAELYGRLLGLTRAPATTPFVEMDYWAEQFTTQPGRTYPEHGDIGVYRHDPDRHLLELIAPA